MKKLQILNYLLGILFFFNTGFYAQKPDSTKEKPTQYRRGIELKEGYQSYDEKYAGKNINEEKRRLFPLRGETGVWTELNPKVPRVDYLGIHFVHKDTGWAVGDLGALIKTTDGGNSWTVSETNTTTPILKVRSYNGQSVIASGFNGLILRSTDGGKTFSQVTSGVTGDLWGLQMINDTLGWACGNSNSLIKTTDGGQNWQKVITPGYTSDYWWIDFLNENYGFIAANGKVLRTTNGGNNWEIIQAGDNQPLFSIDVIDSLHIAAAGYGGTSYRGKNIYSSDGGYTWINGGPLTFEAVNCIQYINPDTGYLVMTNVSARKTTNRGEEWTTIQGISDNYELQFLGNLNERRGYSAGTGLKLSKAVENLDLWNRLIINDNFADVFFISEEKGFAISNILYRTTDGGNNWERVPNAPGGSIVIFIDSLIGFIGSNTIYKTTNGGESWDVTNITGLTDSLGNMSRVFFSNSEIGWAVTTRGGIVKTIDAGENWFAQLNVGISVIFRSIYFIDSLYGWTANASQWPYKTTDGGENWIQQTNLNIFNTRDIYFLDSLNGFTIKILELYNTTNSGVDWFSQLNSQYVLRNFGWLSDNHGFIVGDGVYETSDSGNTWQEILELRNVGLVKLHSPKIYLGYSVGNLGLIYKYIDTTIIPVELNSFSANVDRNKVMLSWSTSSELNNRGFDIERSTDKTDWKTIGFVEGNSTTTEISNYTFTDNLFENYTQKLFYRLKQIDFDGTFEYSGIIEIEVGIPSEFFLSQNYPNPFNPSTTFKYSIRDNGIVNIKVYNILGTEVAELVNEYKAQGEYSVTFDGSHLSSGTYFYVLRVNDFTAVRKMVLLK